MRCRSVRSSSSRSSNDRRNCKSKFLDSFFSFQLDYRIISSPDPVVFILSTIGGCVGIFGRVYGNVKGVAFRETGAGLETGMIFGMNRVVGSGEGGSSRIG